MKQKKYHKKRITVTTKVMIAIAMAPHLIGMHRQQVYPLVNSLAHTHSQQQHSSKTGGAYGSSSGSSAGFSDFFSDYCFSDFGFSDFGGSSAGGSSAASPPSIKLSYSLY